jgi:hypothetical protein
MNGTDSLIFLLLILALLMLASPLVFLKAEVRRRPALAVAAGTIVAGSYFLLLWFGPFLIWIIIASVAGMNEPTKGYDLNQDQTFAGILFPKGSRVTTINGGMLSTDKPQFITLSKETEISGIPAGKNTFVEFSLDDGRVISVKTGREWIYQGISIPAGSTVLLNGAQFKAQVPHNTSGISQILIEQPRTVVTHVEDMLVYGTTLLNFDGDKLTALDGRYEWNGEYYKSYRVGVDGQIQRIRDDNQNPTNAKPTPQNGKPSDFVYKNVCHPVCPPVSH